MLAVLALGASGLPWFTHEAQAQAGPNVPATPVQVAAAQREDVPVYLTGLGTVQAFNTVTVRAQVDGQLQKVLFTEGQMVKQGDVLAEIDPRSYQAAFDQATAKIQQDQANLNNAEAMLARDQKLASQDFASQQTLDTQRSTVEQLKAQVAQDQAARDAAAVQLSYTKLVAPLSGRTGVRLVDAGNIVHAADSTGLVVITQTQPISVVSPLPEAQLPLVHAALNAGAVPVTAFTGDGATELGSGTLSLISNQIDQASGTIQLKSTFPNSTESLWPGQFVSLRLQQQIVRNAVTIPSAAVQRGQAGFFVYVVGSDDVIQAHPVELGQIAAGRSIVRQGVAEGERVVTSGAYRLEPGIKVSIDDAPQAAPKR
ncbi:efflux RND transporter periplasmic adaptor subunit [Bosea caraganae]|uniref:Efflux RND transporter periplasmic adaptor subunit n=2 Tax=Bosea caraganae TaxID=2763117 RepID=A0A370LAL0_9HYPH|nr:efflux RND transporter periplasmic adaptor subunit [Bosea caraganae]RDJ28337.1 efflux RND transporter periplasmic adaptor subunit [Bosea caraganae]